MRVLLQLQQTHVPQRVPLNLNLLQTALIYSLIERSDADFASWLHEQGYEHAAGSVKRFKLFCYSPLLVEKQHRRIVGDQLEISAPQVEWILSSPSQEVLRHLVAGLFAGDIRLGNAHFQLTHAQTEVLPDFTELAARGPVAFTCLSPIVVSRRESPGSSRTVFLTSEDPVGFSEGVRRNLINKFTAHFGHAPTDDRLELRFDEKYLARLKSQGKLPTKLISIHNVRVRGVLCPFTLQGSAELMALGYSAGLGEKGSIGFGMGKVS